MVKAKHWTSDIVGKTYGFRSGLEEAVANQLKSYNIEPHYEEYKLSYEVHKKHKYTPDFMFGNIVIETKGRFLTSDRMKMLELKKQYPDIDFRFIFTNSKSKISKTSATTYARWCEKNGFKYADKLIPQGWLEEIKGELK